MHLTDVLPQAEVPEPVVSRHLPTFITDLLYVVVFVYLIHNPQTKTQYILYDVDANKRLLPYN